MKGKDWRRKLAGRWSSTGGQDGRRTMSMCANLSAASRSPASTHDGGGAVTSRAADSISADHCHVFDPWRTYTDGRESCMS